MKQSLIFKKSELFRDSLTKQQQKEIANLYKQWARELGRMAERYDKMPAPSASLQAQRVRELQQQVLAMSRQVSREVQGKIRTSIFLMSEEVVRNNAQFLSDLGFPQRLCNIAFSSVPDRAVRRLVTGQIYDSGWSLSKAIWGDSQKTMKDIYTIVAQGMTQNQSIYDIAKNLESYVDPSKKKLWNLRMKDGAKIYKRSVDYNAQRLARTLVQHSYQTTFVEVTQPNPFIEAYRWDANGSRTCEICASMDGEIFKKDDLPMDHPNGMCVMEPVINWDESLDEMADWLNSPPGTYPEIDRFAEMMEI